MTDRKNITWHGGSVTQEDREHLLRQKGCVLWFTGLSGSGKSTIARALEEELVKRGHPAYVLDGDNVRHGLNSDLGFSPESREENIRRIGEVAALFADAGLITITAFISPYRRDRERARTCVGSKRFLEIFIDTPLAVCESRDPKKLYAKARSGELNNFTGIDAPYEPPKNAEISVRTHERSVADCVEEIVDRLRALSVVQE